MFMIDMPGERLIVPLNTQITPSEKKSISLGFKFVCQIRDSLTSLQDRNAELGKKGETGEELSGDIVCALREIHHDALAQFDSAWSYMLVSHFYKASKSLGLGFEDRAYTDRTADILLNRLEQDIIRTTVFSHDRIRGVQASLRFIDRDFTSEHRDRIAASLFDHFDTELRLGNGCLNEAVKRIDHAVERMEFGMNHPQTLMAFRR